MSGYPVDATFSREQWRGAFISAEPEADAAESYGTLLRKEFFVAKPVRSATLVCTAHGIYHALLNGELVSRDELSPGWTSYNKRLLYQSYDVTPLLRPGANALGVMLGAGWYKGVIGYQYVRNLYGARTAFGGQLILRYADGTQEWILTDESWRGSRGPVLFSEIYDGETYDARLEQPGWACPGFDDGGWRPAERVERDISTLFPQEHPPVREQGRITPIAMFTTPEGDTVVDFGQNLTGWCETAMADTRPGDVLELQFFEVLDAAGNVYTENLRSAKETLRYVCRGAAREVYRPWFSFQGFRYAKVASFPGTPRLECFTACVVHSDLKQTGSFRCSHPLINQLWHNILWGMKGNFVDVPTDCPQRDERLGWTGDICVFAPTAAYLMDIRSFARKWLADLAADQAADGSVPHVAPDVLTGHLEGDDAFQGGASCWGDACIVLPWVLYRYYGDREVLRQQMPSMRAWLRFVDAHSEGCRFQGPPQFGDWVGLDAEPGSYKGATPDEYTSAAWYCYATRLVSGMLRILGEDAEADAMAAHADELRADFRRRFFDAEGNLSVDTQTAHVLALAFDLVEPQHRARTAAGLKRLLERSGGHLTTGFMGTPFLAAALSDNGLLEEAYELVLKEDFPSWLYQVKQGATTVWEHWDGLRPDGTMWSPDMNSFNHYAYGSVGEWLVTTVAGLRIDDAHPGYEHFFVRPQIGGGLTWAEAEYESARGRIAVRWERSGEDVTLDVTVPEGSAATLQLTQAAEILDGGGLAFAETTAHAQPGRWRVRYRIG